MIIQNKATNGILFGRARFADTFFKRAFGLLSRRGMDEDEALVFARAPCIHTFFMRFAIDIIFLNKEGKVIKLCENIEPFRLACGITAAYTIETAAGTSFKKHIYEGQTLSFIRK